MLDYSCNNHVHTETKFIITILFANLEPADASVEKSGGIYVLKRACANNCCSRKCSLSKYMHPPKACTANSLSSAGLKPKVSPETPKLKCKN